MARIYAKFNSGSEAWNPLDPNNWIGGVVPGPGDTAQFYRYKQTGGNHTYENNYNYISQPYEFDSNQQINSLIWPTSLDSTGSYSKSWYNRDYARNFGGYHASGSPELVGSQMAFGSTGDGIYYHGYYYQQNGSNVIGTARSYNRTTENNWKFRYKNSIGIYSNYGYWYYRKYARSYYIYYNNRTNTSFTVDGVTIGPETDNETYYWGWRRWDQTREQAALEGTHSMADRMVDLFTGSALHVSNGGRWNIIGPHNGTGNSTDDTNRNIRRQFTIYCDVAEDESYTPSFSSVDAGNNNMTQYDMSRYYRAHFQYAISRSTAVEAEFPVIVYEGTSSIKYGTPFTSSDNGYGYYYLSGSGHIYLRDYLGSDMGAGPGNYGQIKVEYKDPQINNLINPNFFTSHGKWINSESISVPTSPNHDMINLNTGHLSNQPISYNTQYYTDLMLQKWELTGSQHWQVGRIEMGNYSHFHVKNDARITLIDMENTTYPTIDMQDYEKYPTLILSDQASIYLSSSRSSEIHSTEAGIYQYDNYSSVIISGSANFSSSKLSNAASAEDTSIEIDSLQSNFGIGDYISIESTGSLILTADLVGSATYNSIASDQTPIIDTGSGVNYWSGSSEQLRERHGWTHTNNGVQNPSSGSTFLNSNRPDFAVSKLYSHTIENDELVQIESMSGDFATISKMYGKRGEIQSDMGLYSFDQFTQAFGESPSTNYYGTKRVVLVDSNHRNFKAGDKLVISGSKVCTVLHATTYLSQSHYYDFTSSNSPALDQVFDLEPKSYSGSSIFTTNTGTYGVTHPSVYYAEQMFKWRLLITGSFQGSNSVPFPHISNAYNSNRYGGSSGSFNNYVALKLDPTLAYTWRNISSNASYYGTGLDGGTVAKSSAAADWHTVYSTNYLYGWYQLKDTHNFVEGEITVSGSLLRDGRWDPTSSQSTHTQNAFGFRIADLPWTGVHKHGDDEGNYGNNVSQQYMSPYPYGQGVVANSYPSVGINIMSTAYNNWLPLTEKGKFADYTAYNKPGSPTRYYYRAGGKALTEDPVFQTSGLNFAPASLNYTASFGNMTGSQYLDLTGSNNIGVPWPDSTFAIKSKIQNGINHIFVAKGDNEFQVEQKMSNFGRGRISLYLKNYASIYSVDIKTRWQQLILDTQDSFSYRDYIKEGGLLNTHYANKDVKFIATEVVDAKGFKNLLWDWEYTKGSTNIKPYIFANCVNGTYAGSTSMTYGYNQIAEWSGCDLPLLPGNHAGTRYYTQGQANDNFYIIYDLRTQVTFDTIGMVFHQGSRSVTHEYDVDNQMNNVEFQVCDDVGVANPAWETVRVKSNDIRRSSGQGNIRFYTFPSGSVTKRYVKYHSRGGTKNGNYYHHSVFGLYNFSGSCAASNTLDASSVAGGFAEQIGGFSAGPTGSMWQVELANVKNFKVGDSIFFWSKQMGDYNSLGSTNSNYYDNYNSVTNTRNGILPENEKLGGFGQTHRIVAINGNNVTLHKPITRRHIGKGTLAYKFNRGNVIISGSRNTPFRLYAYNTANTRTIQNATFYNAYCYRYSGYEYGGINSMQDVGFDTYHAGYHNGGTYPGLYKNVVSPGAGFRMNGHRNGLNKQTQNLYYNILQFGYGTNYGWTDSFYIGNNKQVINFCTAGPYGATYSTRLFNQYGYGAVGNVSGKYILKNSYIPESLYNDLSISKGLSIRYDGGPAMSNLSKLIEIDNLVVAGGDGNQARWYDRTYSQTAWQGNDQSHSTTNILRYNDWFFPFHTNRRGRKSQHQPSSNYAGLDYLNVIPPLGKIGAPNLQRGTADNFVAPGKDYLYTYLSSYMASVTMKSNNFDTSGFYEHYILPTGNFIKANQTDRTHHIYSCNFQVLEETQVRLDLDMIYKNVAANIYNLGSLNYATNRAYNHYGSSHPCIMLLKLYDPNDTNKNNRVEEVFYLDKLEETINYNKIVNVTPGTYQFVFHLRGYYYQAANYIISFKDLEFRIVTPNLSKIEILYNNWDMHRLLDQPDHYEKQPGFPTTQNFGVHRVLKQSSDLGGTTNYKFNKIKL